MNELKTITINNTDISVKEYRGKRVVTLKEIDQCHGRPDGTARKRFNDNKAHFIEGEDFFKASYNEIIESPLGGRSIFDIPNETEGYRGIDYSGFIYIVQDLNNGYWKIGRTSTKKTVEKRLNLSRTYNLENYQYFECVDTLRADKIIQDKLKPYKIKNSWYDCDINLIIKEVKGAISKVSATHEPRKKHKGGFRGNVTLITESGYLMLVKSFTDDLAWDVQRQLVNSYFKVTKSQPNSETAKMRAEAMLLNAKNRTAKQMLKLWSDAGIKPQYQALSLNNYYDGLEIPRIAFKDEVTALYDATTIASHLGVMSKSGKPHAQAIGAIIEKLKPLEANEWAMTPYSRNGHDDESIQYAVSVEKKVADWLIENNYPTVIKNKCKNFSVLYKERDNTPK